MMVVYGIRRIDGGKIYVGQTSASLVKRIQKHVWLAKHGSPLPIHRAIRKYGVDSFDVIRLAAAGDVEQLDVLEQYFIAELKAYDPKHGYNLTAGGGGKRGFKVSALTKAKIGAANTGKNFSSEARKNMSVAHLGNTPTHETRLKMSQAQKATGNKPPVGAHRGYKHSKEAKLKMSSALKGRRVSDETRRKMGEGQSRRRAIERNLQENLNG